MSQRIRAKAVSRDAFLKAYVAGVKAGKTREEVCNDLGMNQNSFDVRVSQERARIEKASKNTKTLPSLKGSNGPGRRGMSDESALDILGDILEEVETETASA